MPPATTRTRCFQADAHRWLGAPTFLFCLPHLFQFCHIDQTSLFHSEIKIGVEVVFDVDAIIDRPGRLVLASNKLVVCRVKHHSRILVPVGNVGRLQAVNLADGYPVMLCLWLHKLFISFRCLAEQF